jgi:hypothetical protein
LAEVNTPDPLPPQPFGSEDWRVWVGRFLSWFRPIVRQLATKDDVRRMIDAALKAKGL